MVATNLKRETMTLMEKRSAIEVEMNSIIERLSHPGGPGLSGNLIDSEGFPRTDVDIPVVRAERHRLAELKNDHKVITEKIDQNIQLLHSSRLAPKVSPSGVATDIANQGPTTVNPIVSASSNNVLPSDSIGAMDVDINVPFAVVDEIAVSSPAADDGLQLGDQIVKYGNVEAGDNLLQKLSSESQTNQGRPIPVVLVRQGSLINFTVTPRSWQGRGLLGCHFRVL